MIALVAAAALAASTPQDPAKTMEALEHMYQQSCSVKAYGSYDDVCNGLRKQMKEAEKRYKKSLAENRGKPAAEVRPSTTASNGPAAPASLESFAPTKN